LFLEYEIIRKLPRSGVVTVVEICVVGRTKIENIV
jgi:hypothetical protein